MCIGGGSARLVVWSREGEEDRLQEGGGNGVLARRRHRGADELIRVLEVREDLAREHPHGRFAVPLPPAVRQEERGIGLLPRAHALERLEPFGPEELPVERQQRGVV